MIITDNLELRIYSYKELCAVLGDEPKAGNSKIAQKKEWERYFRWSNPTTQQYLIEEIYETPHEKVDKRKNNGGNNTSKYLALDDMIMDYFIEIENFFEGTMSRFCVSIGVLTEKYLEYYNAKFGLVQQGVPTYVVNKFFWNIRSCVHRSAISALDRLNKEGYLDVQRHITLKLKKGYTVDLDDDMTNEIVRIEENVRRVLGLSHGDLQNEENEKEFKRLVCATIFEDYGYDVQYYFRMYNINLCGKEYHQKSDEEYDRLIRKFVMTVACGMLPLEIPDDPEGVSSEYTQTQMIRDVIELLNRFFSYMSPRTWERYWEGDIDFSDNAGNRDNLFWTQFCLVKYHDDLWKKRMKEKNTLSSNGTKSIVNCREKAIGELGIDDVVEYERIIPNLNWEKILNATDESDEYLTMCVNALKIYYDVKDMYTYHKEQEVVEEYALFVAKEVANGKNKDEIISMSDFEL